MFCTKQTWAPTLKPIHSGGARCASTSRHRSSAMWAAGRFATRAPDGIEDPEIGGFPLNHTPKKAPSTQRHTAFCPKIGNLLVDGFLGLLGAGAPDSVSPYKSRVLIPFPPLICGSSESCQFRSDWRNLSNVLLASQAERVGTPPSRAHMPHFLGPSSGESPSRPVVLGLGSRLDVALGSVFVFFQVCFLQPLNACGWERTCTRVPEGCKKVVAVGDICTYIYIYMPVKLICTLPQSLASKGL